MLRKSRELQGQPILLQLRDLHLGLARRDGVVVHRYTITWYVVSNQAQFMLSIMMYSGSTTPQLPVVGGSSSEITFLGSSAALSLLARTSCAMSFTGNFLRIVFNLLMTFEWATFGWKFYLQLKRGPGWQSAGTCCWWILQNKFHSLSQKKNVNLG